MKNKLILKFRHESGLLVWWFKSKNNQKWFLKQLELEQPIIFNRTFLKPINQ